jgi:hypothetical protein
MEDVCIFTAILSILWPFGIFRGHLVYFSRFGMLHRDKSGNHARLLRPEFELSATSKKVTQESLN